MNTVTRAREALDELAAELAHAEHLIADQADRIEVLTAEVARLQRALGAREAAA